MISRIAVVLIIYHCLILLTPSAFAEREHEHWIRRAGCGEGATVSESCVERAKDEYRSRHGHGGHGHHHHDGEHSEHTSAGGESGAGGSGSSGSGGGASGDYQTASVSPQTQMPSAGALAAQAITQMFKNQNQGSTNSAQPSQKTVMPGAETGAGEEDPSEPPSRSANSGYPSASQAQAEAARDLATCSSAQSRANQCCNNPMSCSGGLDAQESKSLKTVSNLLNAPPSNGGLTDYCKQMNSLGSDAEKVNVGFGNVCFDSHMECNVTCDDLADKYDELLSNCNGCDAQSVYENARRSLASSAKACDGLTSKTTQLANNGFSTILNQNMAKYCNQVAAVNSGATASAQAVRSAGMPNSPGALAMNCSDPNQPDCKAIKEGHLNGQETPYKVKKNDMSVDAAGGFKGYGNSQPTTQAPKPSLNSTQAKTQAPVAGAATLNSQSVAPKTQAPNAVAGKDKEKPVEKKADAKPEDAKKPERAPASEEIAPIDSNDSQFSGEANLKQFLPGGSRAAGRRLAGGNEINAKEEDIFLRISNKIMEKCRLGILLECR